MAKGLLVVFTGEGKGKTTAALGMAMRAAGHGMRVLVLQFIKGSWPYGELSSFEKVEHVRIKTLGTGFTWKKESMDEDRELAKVGWEEAVDEIRRSYYQMIVLDELNYVLSYGLLPIHEVVEALRNRPENIHVVATGRNAPEELLDAADLVSEMRLVKHPFRDSGVKAQKGIEF